MVERVKWYCGPNLDGCRADLAPLEKLGNHIAERKKDGRWCAIHVGFYGDRKHKFESRAGNEHSGSMVCGFVNLNLDFLGKGTVLVGELEAGTEAANKRFVKLGHRRVWLYDVPSLRDHDLRKMIYGERRILLRKDIWKRFSKDAKRLLPLVEDTNNSFIRFYDKTLKDGDEGVLIKRTDISGWSYRASGKTDNWIRIKPSRTIDYVVMCPDKTESGELTAWLGLWNKGKLRKVLKYQLPEMTLLHNGKLAEEGLVVEMCGRELFKSGSLRSCQFVQWRPDKTPEMCTGKINKVMF